MRIQIVHEDGTVIFSPALNKHLETDLIASLGTHHKLRLFKRSHVRYLEKRLNEVAGELRDATRF